MATSTLTPPRRGGERAPAPRVQIGPVTLAIRAVRADHPEPANTVDINVTRLIKLGAAVMALHRRVDDFLTATGSLVRPAQQDLRTSLIAFLDLMDGDTDREPDYYAEERSPDGRVFLRGRSADDEDEPDLEVVNEDGGDILDAPQLNAPEWNGRSVHQLMIGGER